VTDWSAAALLLAVLGGAGDAPPSAIAPIQFAQLSVRRQITVRVPLRVIPAPRQEAPVQWKENRRGPKCVPARSILAATALKQRSVDLILRDRSRVRAKFDRDCPALDYYFGFYVTPGPDAQICADRDAVRSRVGGVCPIDAFRRLRAVPKD
jgi:hypothetical protein